MTWVIWVTWVLVRLSLDRGYDELKARQPESGAGWNEAISVICRSGCEVR